MSVGCRTSCCLGLRRIESEESFNTGSMVAIPRLSILPCVRTEALQWADPCQRVLLNVISRFLSSNIKPELEQLKKLLHVIGV